VLEEMGLEVGYEVFERPRPALGVDRAGMVAMMRRRLCVGPERDAEIDALLEADDQASVRRGMAIWWPGGA
jgi:hypothetical protein